MNAAQAREVSSTERPYSYNGGCHCKSFRYSVSTVSPLTDQKITECNCSICTSRGYLTAYVLKSALHGQNEDILSSYCFGDNEIAHKFCKNCGTGVFSQVISGPYIGMIALNVRTVDNLDLKSLMLQPVDGRRL